MADRDFPDWIDKLAKLADKVGLNGVKVRWRLQRWHNQMQGSRRRAEQAVDHVRYEHKVCPSCGAVNDRESSECVRCQAPLGNRVVQMLRRIGLRLPRVASVSTLLVIACVLVYFRIMAASNGDAILTVRTDVLVRYGAFWEPAYHAGQWWRISTAIFVHIGVWHLLFNSMALVQVGPLIEEVFGRGRMLFFFMVTGIFSFWCSHTWGIRSTAGASGALMGLVGVAAAFGHRQGTRAGKELRDQMLKWAVYTIVFGYFIGANNVGHGTGFALGAVLGWVTPPSWLKQERQAGSVSTFLTLASLVAAVGTVWLALFPNALTNELADALKPRANAADQEPSPAAPPPSGPHDPHFLYRVLADGDDFLLEGYEPHTNETELYRITPGAPEPAAVVMPSSEVRYVASRDGTWFALTDPKDGRYATFFESKDHGTTWNPTRLDRSGFTALAIDAHGRAVLADHASLYRLQSNGKIEAFATPQPDCKEVHDDCATIRFGAPTSDGDLAVSVISQKAARLFWLRDKTGQLEPSGDEQPRGTHRIDQVGATVIAAHDALPDSPHGLAALSPWTASAELHIVDHELHEKTSDGKDVVVWSGPAGSHIAQVAAGRHDAFVRVTSDAGPDAALGFLLDAQKKPARVALPK